MTPLLRAWWLEIAGWPRRRSRVRWLLLALAVWTVGIAAATAASIDRLREELGAEPMPVVAGLTVVVFLVAPLVSGAGTGGSGLLGFARFPVTPRSLFGAGWVQALADVQFVAMAPVLIGLAAREGVLPVVGTVLLLVTLAGAGVSSGHLGAALAGAVRRPALSMGALLAVVVGCVVALVGFTDVAAADLPGRLTQALPVRTGAPAWTWFVVLGALVLVAVTGPVAVRAAWRVDAAPVRTDTRPRSSIVGAGIGALIVADLRGMLRPVAVRTGLVSMLGVPFLALLAPDRSVTVVSIIPVVVLAIAVVLSVNGFAYAAGGLTLLVAAPRSRRDLLRSRAASTALVVSSVAALAVGPAAVALPLGGGPLALVTAVVAPTAVCVAVTTWTSVRFPAPADHDHARVRPAPLSGMAAALVVCLPVVTVIGALSALGRTGIVAALVVAVVVSGVAATAASDRFEPDLVTTAVR